MNHVQGREINYLLLFKDQTAAAASGLICRLIRPISQELFLKIFWGCIGPQIMEAARSGGAARGRRVGAHGLQDWGLRSCCRPRALTRRRFIFNQNPRLCLIHATGRRLSLSRMRFKSFPESYWVAGWLPIWQKFVSLCRRNCAYTPQSIV